MKILALLARAWVALTWLAVFVVAFLLLLVCWPLVRQAPPVRRRGLAPPADCGCDYRAGQWFPCDQHRIEDDAGDNDVVAEGGFCGAWPGIATIDAIRAANPQLTDMHAYAVAQARQRLAVR